ncbi:hypothetical protein RSSM_00255 [Rhodopirellula sallentina SM41]|uniref:Uncharacterized protein n=1 Tax=Rhodopirellula sallentina SM41 TaxID=1263870 RepID=M5UA63_9BACT|nr:hypothetical protein RSSM_00255 [Rhodopirellula sallentina SM41]
MLRNSAMNVVELHSKDLLWEECTDQKQDSIAILHVVFKIGRLGVVAD